jgi:hypothetical protein
VQCSLGTDRPSVSPPDSSRDSRRVSVGFATFFVTGMAHSIVGGTAWEPTPWRAVQRAAWGDIERDGCVMAP